MNTEDLATASLADVGRFIAGRLGDPIYAKIARSFAPQLRYDGHVLEITKDPGKRAQFTLRELEAMISRIEDPTRRRAAADQVDPARAASRLLTASAIAQQITDDGLWTTREEFEGEWDFAAGEAGWTEAEITQAKDGAFFPWPADR